MIKLKAFKLSKAPQNPMLVNKKKGKVVETHYSC